MESQELIVIEQLPIIKEQLKKVSEDIDEKIKYAKSLVCTEETVKAVKELRASLNKDFKHFEVKRKEVKERILAPYMHFEEVYKECISNKFKSADSELKQKIDNIEDELKAKKEIEIIQYFEEYKTANNIDFVTYEQAKINVTLTASIKSLKAQVKEFIDKIIDDLNLINTQEHKVEILLEYKQSLNVSKAIATVLNRIKAIEKEKTATSDVTVNCEKKQDYEEKLQKEINKDTINDGTNPKIYTITFKVTDTSVRLKQLHDYLIKEEFKYE